MSKGILFKPWKIKAIAEGGYEREWQTRRLIKPQPERGVICKCPGDAMSFANFEMYLSYRQTGWIPIGKSFKPRFQLGDIVYIKETWWYPPLDQSKNPNMVAYRLIVAEGCGEEAAQKQRWNSPLFMPEWAARYFIQITGVKAERLQEITKADVIEEGVGSAYYSELENEACYKELWDSINKEHQWAENPFVFVYSFKLREGRMRK